MQNEILSDSFWIKSTKKQHMYTLSLSCLTQHENRRQSTHKFGWRVRMEGCHVKLGPFLRQKAQQGVYHDVVGPEQGNSDFWGIIEGTVSTICDLACFLACRSRRLGVNNVFVAVTGVERRDTVEEIVPNTWKSQQREQIDMSSKCCCQTSKMLDKREQKGFFFFSPKPQKMWRCIYFIFFYIFFFCRL